VHGCAIEVVVWHHQRLPAGDHRCWQHWPAALTNMAWAAPALPAIRGAEIERIAYLTPTQENRLLGSYSQWAAPVMIVLCETGLRTQEALRLDGLHVDWDRGALIVEHAGRRDRPRTKTGKSRRVGMRPVVRATLLAIWSSRVGLMPVPYSSTNWANLTPIPVRLAGIP
jgi:integrase